jgi:GNAT superfamily N-acetyltransferase
VDVEIRRAVPAETELVSEILTEATLWLRSCGMTLWRPEQLTPQQTEPDVRSGHFFLAFSGDAAVGTMRLTPADPRFWPDALPGEALYLHRLAVRRAAAGGHVSSALMRQAVAHAVAEGAAFLRLDCDRERPRLRQVYERFGFWFHSERDMGSIMVVRYQLATAAAS